MQTATYNTTVKPKIDILEVDFEDQEWETVDADEVNFYH